jgi:HK97 family phage portal protein
LGGWYPFDVSGDGFQRNIGIPNNVQVAADFACKSAYAQTLASMPIKHHKKTQNGGRELIHTSSASRIFKNPNEYQTGSDFRLNLIFELMTHGNAYAVAFRNSRFEVDSLHLVPSRGTYPYVDPESKAVYYAVGNNPLVGDIAALAPARDVLHIRLNASASDPLRGTSPIGHAAISMAINQSIANNQAAFFNNMSRPSGAIVTDEQLTRDQMESLRNAWEHQSRGMNAGKVPILGWGLKWQPMTITSQDAQLLDAYKMSIEDIARVYRVPLALIGAYQQATYNNVETLVSAWLATGLGFVMEHVEASFAKFFRLPSDELCDFDVDVLLRTDFKSRIDGLAKGVQSGIYSPNEVRAREGLPAVEYGDEPRVQQQVVPLSQVGMIPEAPPAPQAPEPAPPTEEELAFSAYTAKQAIRKMMTEA